MGESESKSGLDSRNSLTPPSLLRALAGNGFEIVRSIFEPSVVIPSEIFVVRTFHRPDFSNTINFFLKTGGNIVYFYYHHREKHIFNQCILAFRTIQDTIFIISICLYKIHLYNPLICVQHKALFNVISRLEVILAILVPIFAQENLVKRTVSNISLFILYDFFSDYYYWFTFRLKWALWLFVVFITISVVNEWLYFVNHQWRLCDQISTGMEFLAECACCLVIIWQFRPPIIEQSLNVV
jgi:hypothetical protein